jgi:hypothetical protein
VPNRIGKIAIIPAGEKRFRIVWPKNETKLTQAEIASTLSFVLDDSVGQPRINEMCGKVKKWMDANLPVPDYSQWVEGPSHGEFTGKELTKLIDSEKQIFRPKSADPWLNPPTD